MMWDAVLERAIARIKGNATLAEIFGDNVRMAGTGDLKVPSVEFTLLSDTNNELWAPILVQFDLWTDRAADNRQAERIVLSLFDLRVPGVWDDVMVMSDYVDGSTLASPARSGFSGRGLRFRISPLRQQHAIPSH